MVVLLELTPREYEPPSLCHTGLETLFGLGALGAGEAAVGTAAAATAADAAFGLTAAELSTALGETAAVAGSSLPSLSTLGTVASVAGTGLQAVAQGQEAKYQQAVAKNQAEALRIKAGEEAAAAQRRQATELRKAGLITSRARALAAASGTDATSPTQLDIEGDIGRQGDYNALSALYEGLSASRADNYQADIQLFKGKRVGAAAPLAIGGTLLSGLSSFADRRSRRSLYGSSFFGFE